jgi:DNA-binding NarL/FixJ family response regulator
MLAADDPADPRLPAIIERAHHLGRSGLEEARRAIGLLRDDELPGPALRQVLDNHAVIDPAVQHHVVDAIAAGPGPLPDPGRTASPLPALPALPAGLTPREAQVLSLIAAGLSNAEIAEQLVISEGTVKSHVNHLLAKINARDRAQAVAFAYQNGLATPAGAG